MIRSLLYVSFTVSLISCGSLKNGSSVNPKFLIPGHVQYTREDCYSRAIVVADSIVYTANSNGSIWQYDLRSSISTKRSTPKSGTGELRDLVRFSDGRLLAMHSGDNGLLTEVSSQVHTITDSSLWKGVFLDGFDFDENNGFMMGDPVHGRFSLFVSRDGGQTWKHTATAPEALEGEAGFAASGTTVHLRGDSTLVFVSGGKRSRLYRSEDFGQNWEAYAIPFGSGEGSGAFSLCFVDDQYLVAVGGDYTNPDSTATCVFYSSDGGKSWTEGRGMYGYRSCVICVNEVLYACGTNGIDYSTDLGKTWKAFSDERGFAMTSDGQSLYVTTPNGSFSIFPLIRN